MAGLWKHLLAQGQQLVYLVLPEPAWEILREIPELAPLQENFVIPFPNINGSWRVSLRRTIQGLHAAQPGSIFHLVMAAPWEAQRFRSSRILFTVPISGMGILSWKGQLGVVLGALTASRTDCLEERVHRTLCRLLPWKKGALSVTPSSYIDLEFYRPQLPKADRLVFSGLFSKEKQIERLLQSIPEIHRQLVKSGTPNPVFFLLGRETDGDRVARACQQMRPEIQIYSSFEPDPLGILASAKVIFSLQRQTNYPSKSLLEGMACGCVPVLTNTGHSERIVPPGFGCYVPRDFSPQDIAQACVAAFRIQNAEGGTHLEKMRLFLAKRFSVTSMADYYTHLYDQLAYL